jgi:hypothetical protein
MELLKVSEFSTNNSFFKEENSYAIDFSVSILSTAFLLRSSSGPQRFDAQTPPGTLKT